MDGMTAEKLKKWLDDAAEAVRDLHAAGPEQYERAHRRARSKVDMALGVGHTAAAIAAGAGVRQLVVIGLIDEPQQRAKALVAARHDAERYLEQVRDEVRAEAIRRWYYAGTRGSGEPPHGTKAAIATDLDVARPTLDKWLADLDASRS